MSDVIIMIYINATRFLLSSQFGKYHNMIKTCCSKHFVTFFQTLLIAITFLSF